MSEPQELPGSYDTLGHLDTNTLRRMVRQGFSVSSDHGHADIEDIDLEISEIRNPND